MLHIPAAPALVVGADRAIWLEAGGGAELLPFRRVNERLAAGTRPLVCHARNIGRKLGHGPFQAFDLLELFAFVRPAVFCLPTPKGLAAALDLPLPGTPEKEAATLFLSAGRLLAELAAQKEARPIAWTMHRGGWAWGEAVLGALDLAGEEPHSGSLLEALRIWNRLGEWSEFIPEPPDGHWPVEPVEARARLVKLLGSEAEARPQQAEYASLAASAFAPRDAAGEPKVMLLEAGTGVGKTLGYIAPASVWAEKNQGTVWISTFTRNLQRQLDAELDRLYPDPDKKALKAVVRKGRENYLCLLNLEEAVSRQPLAGGPGMVPLGLVARWALASRDGDMIGGDFPAWLVDLLGRSATMEMTDTRGECIYSACPHYRKCFIERTIRRARRAEIVVANHALVMIQAAMGGGDEGLTPQRYVFDEGHHVFSAACSAFSAHLSGREAGDLRRWLLGAEEGARSRMRGLKARISDLLHDDADGRDALDELLHAARALPGPGWRQRIRGGEAMGPAEAFLAKVRQQVYARSQESDGPYDLEAPTGHPVPGLIEAAADLEQALGNMLLPLRNLMRALVRLLDRQASELDGSMRIRIESVGRTIERRGLMQVEGWRAMLKSLREGTPEEFVDWFGIERAGGHDVDIGLFRHWLDPTRPFAAHVLRPAHGALITSATLRDQGSDAGDGWEGAIQRTGAAHLALEAMTGSVASPFDYPTQTRVFVVGDVNRNDPVQVASAFRELFLAAGGGGLGLFTAIHRLREVHRRIALPLEAAGIPLLAQHMEEMDTGTLIDIFRSEENACLLGTDAVRDGVDVPGRSLRLIVFDRVPWPRPDILFRARRKAFGGRAYDEMLTRLKLRQAYGRLVRRASDHGVFVMLDRGLPSRLAQAFPEGVEVKRCGLAEAIKASGEFLRNR